MVISDREPEDPNPGNKSREESEVDELSEKNWAPLTCLVFDEGQRYIGLKSQTPTIKSVIHAGMDGMIRYGVIENAFPSPDDTTPSSAKSFAMTHAATPFRLMI